MGYVRRSNESQLEIGNTTGLNSFNITNIMADHSINSIAIPTTLASRVSSAYLDLYMPWVLNYNAAENSLDESGGTQSIQVKALVGGSWLDAIYMIDQSMAIPGSTIAVRGRVVGTRDISAQVAIAAATASPSNLLSIQWKNMAAHLDGFTIRMLQAVVRIWAR